ncbi:MAG: hypothetical protein HYS81_05340 [Candidatus Aenigmatarchaeota archaeon]|nr:MAG: hypothetical protein HYS81_05340 [Candidatus Aenigmarchaeota archaeon]
MARWHIFAAVLVGLALLAFGIMNQLGASPSDIGGFADTTRDVFSDGQIARNVTVVGSFARAPLDLSGSPVSSLTLAYDAGDITVNGVRVDAENGADVTVENYAGTLRVDEMKITLDGSANRVRVNGVALDTGRTSVKVKASGLPLTSFGAYGTEAKKFKTSPLTGNVQLQGKVSLTLTDEPLDIDYFLGNVTLGEALEINGKVRRVLVSGKDYATVVS